MDPDCATGNTYELNVDITYDTSAISDQVQHGEKALIGKCA
jgi:hypothetical protein